MKRGLFKTTSFIAATGLVFATSAYAYIPPEQTQITFEAIPKAEPVPLLSNEDVARVIPTQMQSTSDGGAIERQILDRSFNSFISGDFVRKSSVGQAATKVEKAMRADVSLGSPGGVQHKFQLEYQAFQNQAKLGYTGLLDAHVVYQVNDQSLNIDVVRTLSSSSRVVLNHTSVNDTSLVKMMWDW